MAEVAIIIAVRTIRMTGILSTLLIVKTNSNFDYIYPFSSSFDIQITFVAFCLMAFYPLGILSCGIMSGWHSVWVAFCPVAFYPVAFCLWFTVHRTACWPTVQNPDFSTKEQWLPNLPDLNPVDYHVWGAMLEAYCKLKTKPKIITELKEALQVIWGNLPQWPIDKTGKDFSKWLKEGLCRSWWWTLRTFTVTIELWHLIIS